MIRDTEEIPALDELSDEDIVPDDELEAPVPSLMGNDDVTPVRRDPCPECNDELQRIRQDTPPPGHSDQAWRIGQCVATLDGWWRWCQSTGWLKYGELRINFERRSRRAPTPVERRRPWRPKPSAE